MTYDSLEQFPQEGFAPFEHGADHAVLTQCQIVRCQEENQPLSPGERNKTNIPTYPYNLLLYLSKAVWGRVHHVETLGGKMASFFGHSFISALRQDVHGHSTKNKYALN